MKIKPEDVEWEKWRRVLSLTRPDLYEDIDESEGVFMGWRYHFNHEPVTFSEFCKQYLGG